MSDRGGGGHGARGIAPFFVKESGDDFAVARCDENGEICVRQLSGGVDPIDSDCIGHGSVAVVIWMKGDQPAADLRDRTLGTWAVRFQRFDQANRAARARGLLLMWRLPHLFRVIGQRLEFLEGQEWLDDAFRVTMNLRGIRFSGAMGFEAARRG